MIKERSCMLFKVKCNIYWPFFKIHRVWVGEFQFVGEYSFRRLAINRTAKSPRRINPASPIHGASTFSPEISSPGGIGSNLTRATFSPDLKCTQSGLWRLHITYFFECSPSKSGIRGVFVGRTPHKHPPFSLPGGKIFSKCDCPTIR